MMPPTDPALADLLNPGIGQGTAGPGSQTGLQPPPDNSFDRRADFAAAHRARKSTGQGFNEAPQARLRGKARSAGQLDPELAQALGFDGETRRAAGSARRKSARLAHRFSRR